MHKYGWKPLRGMRGRFNGVWRRVVDGVPQTAWRDNTRNNMWVHIIFSTPKMSFDYVPYEALK